mmetsp:Transcript_1272/g.1708  ORF Transcript_1272/g.1708 Transcript_1272/m.1708 type:complete len:223 (-) Transcript_1272:408-1076(-)|eukprot:CAMPEP_0185583636 /NCGR_PEP_ID=MMETSP0434-20130131/26400_1 /TAXON_ID=626734 ORGANISM="Favella taraikaensis, Strain Fe Narragansett Bay" /NCGR_SAMPLE_ID=MMETSP0434 /ASSEMBLY_ACC=CAM_ASM_000379 /LENGTH=222 /DNA_ID=CAMNT_0028202883 /DNA_START=758 /DNA_END=1426 /DNA_ORIENTATION=-
MFDFGESFTFYQVEDTSLNTFAGGGGTVQVQWTQSRIQYTNEWAIVSLDNVLGLVGGLSGIIWAVLAMCLGDYETFKFENSLIGAVYPTAPQTDSHGNDDFDDGPEGEQDAKHTLMATVAERGKYFYDYSEYLLSIFLRTLCCCCKGSPWMERRVKKLERHEAASERLANEIDIVKLLYMQRISSFVSKLVLKKHQRALVTNFKSYQLEDLRQDDEGIQSKA